MIVSTSGIFRMVLSGNFRKNDEVKGLRMNAVVFLQSPTLGVSLSTVLVSSTG